MQLLKEDKGIVIFRWGDLIKYLENPKEPNEKLLQLIKQITKTNITLYVNYTSLKKKID